MRSLGPEEIGEIVEMLVFQELDIRAVTLGLSLQECTSPREAEMLSCVEYTVRSHARRLVEAVEKVSAKYGVDIVTRRMALTPASLLLEPQARGPGGWGEATETAVELARVIDRAALGEGVDMVGGFSAFVHKGFTPGDRAVIEALPRALSSTRGLAGMANVASTMTGVNADAVLLMAGKVLEAGAQTPRGEAAARLAVLANAPEDTPFMPGAYHGLGEPSPIVNVAVSGPGVIEAAVRRAGDGADLRSLHDLVKRTAFKITRLGELVGREVARLLGVEFGIVDLSLAPSPKMGDSIAGVLEAIGVEAAGAPGSLAALYLLVDAVKKGGAMATSSIGGLSGAFIPVSEDAGMTRALEKGALSLDGLMALMTVCNTGIDMLAIPGDTPIETVAGVILDVMAAAVSLDKTLGVRLVPVPGARPGDRVELGGLLGSTIVVGLPPFKPTRLVRRGGLLPPGTVRLGRG